ncbi:MAG TPA: BtpA/SgcQ family protein, partial [Planctomycetota bacterium]|nr:BtpA/SgcQ family protein [Planctomycetota bacterium]
MTLPRRELPRDLLLGVLHLPPLPGSPLATPGALDEAIHKAQTDAATLLAAGFDGFVLENYGDVPFFRGSVPAYVLTCMTRIACEIPRDGAFLVLNVLRNDAIGALSIAAAVGADAVR